MHSVCCISVNWKNANDRKADAERANATQPASTPNNFDSSVGCHISNVIIRTKVSNANDDFLKKKSG